MQPQNNPACEPLTHQEIEMIRAIREGKAEVPSPTEEALQQYVESGEIWEAFAVWQNIIARALSKGETVRMVAKKIGCTLVFPHGMANPTFEHWIEWITNRQREHHSLPGHKALDAKAGTSRVWETKVGMPVCRDCHEKLSRIQKRVKVC